MKVRLKFSKHGIIRYVGHLDIMRYFQKCVRRSGLPIRYSEGFSPHQTMSFASPLGTGIESDGEYADMEFTCDLSPEEIMEKLNAVMHEGIKILSVSVLSDKPRSSMSLVESADYEVICGDVSAAAAALMDKEEISYTAFSKKAGEYRTKNIRPMIYCLKYEDGRLFMHIAQGSSSNLKPQAVLEILGMEPAGTRIIRKELYDAGHIPLSDIAD